MYTADLKELIKRTILHYTTARYAPPGQVEAETIFDDAKGHYELSWIGWNRARRIHGSVIHIDLKGDKIWIQHDGTYHGVAADLMEAGIPPTQIVLAFRSVGEREQDIFAKD